MIRKGRRGGVKYFYLSKPYGEFICTYSPVMFESFWVKIDTLIEPNL